MKIAEDAAAALPMMRLEGIGQWNYLSPDTASTDS